MNVLRLVLVLLTVAGGCSAGTGASQNGNGVNPRVDGPVLCGEAFALRLEAGERFTRNDPRMDFITYSISGPDGNFVLYEGNAPQPSDDVIQTNLQWPSVIAIHDNRSADAKARSGIRSRLSIGNDRAPLCPQSRVQQ